MIAMENDPSVFVEDKVNAITGEWCAVAEDLIIQGVEPIVLRRAYAGGETDDWSICPHLNVRTWKDQKEREYVLTEESGARIQYRYIHEKIAINGENYRRCVPTDLREGYTNTSHGTISSRTNLHNNVLFVDPKDKILLVHSADGTVKKFKKVHGEDHIYLLVSEHLPNGNWVLYRHVLLKTSKTKKQVINLAEIITTNPQRSYVYARALFHYDDLMRKNKHFCVTGSDGQRVEYFYEGSPKKQKGSLKKIISSTAPDLSFTYFHSYYESAEEYYPIHRLTSMSLPSNRTFQVNLYPQWADSITVHGQQIVFEDIRIPFGEPNRIVPLHKYFPDPRRNRVKTLSAPIGTDPHRVTHTFLYDMSNRKTSVFDLEDKRTDYLWDEHFRLQEIAHHTKEGFLEQAERFAWSHDGNLLCKSLLDSNRHLIKAMRYTYDNRGNVLEKQIYGNLSGNGATGDLDESGFPKGAGLESYRCRCNYSDDELHLLISEEEETGKLTKYAYIPGTDKTLSQLTYDQNALKQRRFCEYDTDHLLIRDITDDGTSENPQDLTGVKTRLITQITTKKDAPYRGMPEVVEMKYWELGCEHLLQKTILSYTTGGKIARRDVYDANDCFCYSLSYKYDDKGRLIEETDALGRCQTFTYDACGNQITHKDFSGRVEASFNYDLSNHLISSRQIGDDGIALEEHYIYDDQNRLVREEKPLGLTTTYGYDSFGRKIWQELPSVRTSSGQVQIPRFHYAYDNAGRLIAETNPEGHTKRISYNVYDKPIRIEYPDGTTEQFAYYPNGLLKTTTNQEGITTSYAYDFLGREIEKTVFFQGKLLTEEFCEYDAFHLLCQINAEGIRTSYSYDGAGRLIATEYAGEKTIYEIDALCRQRVEKKGDLSNIREYDNLNRVVEERKEDAQGNTLYWVQYTYDRAGNQNSITRSINGEKTSDHTIYDSIHRPIQQIDPLGQITTTTYEITPCLKETTIDPLGLKTIKEYNAYRQLIFRKTVNSQGQELQNEEYFYNHLGKPLEQISRIFKPERTISTRWKYDPMGRVIQLIEAAGSREEKTTKSSYDQMGRLTQTEKPDGVTLDYAYTPLGLLSSLKASDGSVHYIYSFDRLGRLLSSEDRLTGQMTERQYDPHGYLVKETLGSGYTLHNTYDSMGRRKELVLPDQSSVQYTYDALYLRHVQRLTPSREIAYRHSFNVYDLTGALLEETLIGNLGTLARQYNSCGQLDALITPYSSHEVLKRDAIGNLLEVRLNGLCATYRYDDLSQLIEETGPATHSYLNDAHNCRLQKDDEQYVITPLLQIPSHLTYDPNGNPIRQEEISFHYDALDRLAKVETPTQRIVYVYDSDHRRTSKTTATLKNGQWQKNQQVFFLYDGQNEIGAIDPLGQITELRILGLTSPAEFDSAIAIELQSKVYAPLHDLMANVLTLVSLDSGQIEASYRYGVFGEEGGSNSSLKNPWRYSSKRTDEETGLVYYGRRYYDPTLGRWLTPDPAGYIDGLNLYAFVRNNPLMHRDSYGLSLGDDNYSSGIYDSSMEICNRPYVPRAVLGVGIEPYGDPANGTGHYHCGINNTQASVVEAQLGLYNTLGGSLAIQPHWIHGDSIVEGAQFVILEKISMAAICHDHYLFAGAQTLLKDLCVIASRAAAKKILKKSSMERKIHYVKMLLETNAQIILRSNKPNRKQLHIAFSNGGYVMVKALKRLLPEYRTTVILITCGTTCIATKDLAHLVYNIVGDKDLASQKCNGGLDALKKGRDDANIRIIEQTETQSFISGHYFLQPQYQKAILNMQNTEIKGKYEIQ